jgi:hypothetical protein
MMTLTPEISVDLALDIRMSSAADVSAEFTRQVSKIVRVAAVSSNLKGASIKDLKDAATYVAAAWRELNLQRAEVVHSGSSTAARLAEAKLTAMEEENAALRKEITRLAARIHESPRCNGRAIESGHPPREGKQEGARLDALEKKMDELGPSIMRAIEGRFGGRRPRSPEPRRKADQSAAPRVTQVTMLPREQEGGEWRVVERRPRKKRAARKEEKKEGTPVAPSSKLTGARKTGAALVTKKGMAQATKTAGLSRAPHTSAVTLTINEGVKTSYADVLATARQKVSLAEIGVESLGMRKSMTGGIIIRLPGDKDRGKASRLATRLAEVLDPAAVRVAAPNRTAELRVTGIDISVAKEELREALASAAGCGSAEVQVGEIRTTRYGLGTAWVRCPVAGVRKLTRDGKVALGWSTARVTAIPKRPLQCFKCLELGHVRVTCTSNVHRRAFVLQVWRLLASCQGVSRLRAQVPVVRVAAGASQPQDVQSVMCSAES